jgi:hypothetical protein
MIARSKLTGMSLYYLQKLLYELNREPRTRARFEADRESVLDEYELTEEERAAILKPDIGLLYILGVNGQILMHYATQCGYSWDEYLDAMRAALKEHGQVRDGIYAFVRD